MPAPLLISLPHGFNASGVTMWAVRLANGLAGMGRACGLVVHDEPAGQRAISLPLHPGVEVFDARGLPPLDTCGGDLSDFLPVYRVAAGVLAMRTGGPVVCGPNLVGDSYGVFAALSQEGPDLIRTIAVHHSDLRYNDLLCAHYAEHIAAFVGVSERITSRLAAMLPTRTTAVFGIPYGVEVPAQAAARPPLAGRPVRLLYTGRMDHEQKRITSLIEMSDELCRRGVAHELALLGDGPAADEIDAACASRQAARRFPPTDPAGVAAALESADMFVLGSRYEGLSVSLLEALARGAVPVLTPSRSGTGQLVRDGGTGWIADAGPESSPSDAGASLADAVCRAAAAGDQALHEAREHGRALIASSFSVGVCASRYAEVIDLAAADAPRPWPAHRAAAFTGTGGGSGTVPTDAGERLTSLLNRLRGGRVAVYGTGRHTLELAEVFASSPARVVAFLDDDPARRSTTLWGLPVLEPARIAESGATDIVVSSWLHQQEMAARCACLLGVRVHTLYDGQSAIPRGSLSDSLSHAGAA